MSIASVCDEVRPDISNHLCTNLAPQLCTPTVCILFNTRTGFRFVLPPLLDGLGCPVCDTCEVGIVRPTHFARTIAVPDLWTFV